MTLLRYLSSILIWVTLITLLILQTARADRFCSPNAVETAPESDFVDNGNGTATQTATGLMWKRCHENNTGDRCSSGGAVFFTWEEALNAAQNEVFAGHSDWRLPSVKELMSITEYSCTDPALNFTVFPSRFPDDQRYWSSTPFISTNGNDDRAYSLRILNGLPLVALRTETFMVRFVRDIDQ